MLKRAPYPGGRAVRCWRSRRLASNHMVKAEVVKIDKPAGKITLKHGPIKNLDMDAMTMVFRVADPVDARQGEGGRQDRVRGRPGKRRHHHNEDRQGRDGAWSPAGETDTRCPSSCCPMLMAGGLPRAVACLTMAACRPFISRTGAPCESRGHGSSSSVTSARGPRQPARPARSSTRGDWADFSAGATETQTGMLPSRRCGT